jgi:hypothetical protein
LPAPRDTQAFNRSVIEEFRASKGQVTNPRLSNIPLVLLTTTGARTGRAHTSLLAYLTDGPGRIFVWASAMAARMLCVRGAIQESSSRWSWSTSRRGGMGSLGPPT